MMNVKGCAGNVAVLCCYVSKGTGLSVYWGEQYGIALLGNSAKWCFADCWWL